MAKISSAVFVLSSILFFGCGKKSEMLYYSNPKPEQHLSAHKLKNLVGNDKVDMLWVIDNSGSMAPYQQSVAANTSLFINNFNKKNTLDWKIGVISTDDRESPYLGFRPGDELTSKTPNADRVFMSTVSRLGTSGSGTERTYGPVIQTLKAYPKFLRPEAHLAIILVSDAPEQSNMTTLQFVQQLRTVKGAGENILFYGIICPKEWCRPTDDPFFFKGSKFEELTKFFKSKWYPICEVDFGKNLVDISKDIISYAVHPKLYLSGRPKLRTLKILYKGREIPSRGGGQEGYWSYDFEQNAIVFHDLSFAPGDTEEVEVNYTNDDGYALN